MYSLKRLAVGILVFLLGLSLSIVVASTVFAKTIGQTTKLKSWLRDSKVYEASINSTLDNVSKDAQGSGSTLNQPEVQQVIRQTFTPELVRTTAEKVVDGTGRWLDGKTTKPDFVIDLTSIKQSLAENAGNALVGRLNALPICTRAQLQQISPEADPFTIPCRPATLDIAAQKQKIIQEILDNKNLFANPIITADTIKTDDNHEPVYKEVEKLPGVYRLIKKAPWIFGLLAIMSAAGIVYLTENHRHGLRRVAKSFLMSGITLFITVLITTWLIHRLSSNKNLIKNTSADLQVALQDLGKLAANSINQILLVFAITFSVLGAGALMYLYVTRSHTTPSPTKE